MNKTSKYRPELDWQVGAGPSNTFGRQILWDPPADCNVAILCHNTGFGLKPFRLSLPHQFYTKNFIEYAEQESSPGQRIQSFTIIPAHSSQYVEVAKVTWTPVTHPAHRS